MFELLVPATAAQLDRVKGDKKAYDRDARPYLMTPGDPATPGRRRRAGRVEDRGTGPPGGLRAGCGRRTAGRARHVGCIILGRGEDDAKVRDWLTTAAGVPGFIGFAVGRTTFWEPLLDWRAKKATREATVTEIARRYREWVRNRFEQSQVGATSSSVARTSRATPTRHGHDCDRDTADPATNVEGTGKTLPEGPGSAPARSVRQRPDSRRAD